MAGAAAVLGNCLGSCSGAGGLCRGRAAFLCSLVPQGLALPEELLQRCGFSQLQPLREPCSPFVLRARDIQKVSMAVKTILHFLVLCADAQKVVTFQYSSKRLKSPTASWHSLSGTERHGPACPCRSL